MISRQPYVSDSNVWIDAQAGGVVEALFDLPWEWLAPDVIVAELQDPDGRELVRLGLRECELSGEQVTGVARLAERHTAPSANDLFALVLAHSLKAPLLTGDRHLRIAAEELGVEVHGTVFILDELVRNRCLAEPEAAAALERILAAGARLPRIEVERRLQDWQR